MLTDFTYGVIVGATMGFILGSWLGYRVDRYREE